MRTAALLSLLFGVLLLAGGAALGVRERSQSRLALDHALTTRVDDGTSRLQAYFERARAIMLLTANNPAFRELYASTSGTTRAKVKARGPAIREAETALDFLEQLYPTSIGEVCFIDRSGTENARYVRGVRAPFEQLSTNESLNVFFRPTFALRPGQVYQAEPYLSPDTHQWVISNSAPVPGTGFPAAAIVHFEITVESFRREAATLAGTYDVAIVDATGRVVVDSGVPQLADAPLGRPDDRRFTSLAASGRDAGTTTVDGHRSAFRRLERTDGNMNDWIVVAVSPRQVAPLLGGAGGAPFGLAGAGVLLILLAGISFRTSRRALHEAAHTDSLTDLSNRRQLMLDLEDACDRASGGYCFALVIYDLDGFKSYNDSFGHVPGDALLHRLGQKLAHAVDGWGRAYRLGGDEFCVLASLRGGEQADGLASIGAAALTEEGEGFVIGASYGSVILPDEARVPSSLLATADLRMYAFKQKGRPSAARQTTDALVRALHECSPALGPHSSDVAELADAIAEWMGLPEHRRQLLRQTAELHDVGKIAIPDAVLDKPGPLTPDEWQLIHQHTIVGERIISAAPALDEVAKLVRATHERFDGTGYPDRLAAEEIPLESRIVQAADAFSAMTRTRPYSEAMSPEGALDEVRRCAGTQFDPAVVEALAVVLHEVEASKRRGRRRRTIGAAKHPG